MEASKALEGAYTANVDHLEGDILEIKFLTLLVYRNFALGPAIHLEGKAHNPEQ